MKVSGRRSWHEPSFFPLHALFARQICLGVSELNAADGAGDGLPAAARSRRAASAQRATSLRFVDRRRNIDLHVIRLHDDSVMDDKIRQLLRDLGTAINES